MNNQELLKELQIKMDKDKTLPLLEANLVFGEGNPNASMLFIGEAPGQKEDELKLPFVGRSGQLLDKMLASIHIARKDIYITNIVKRRPPENRDPLPEEIESYRPYLKKQIEIIKPKIIVTLGRFSMNYFLPEAKITRDQGKLFYSHDGYAIVPLLHPAAAMRSTAMMALFTESFKNLPDIIETIVKK